MAVLQMKQERCSNVIQITKAPDLKVAPELKIRRRKMSEKRPKKASMS